LKFFVIAIIVVFSIVLLLGVLYIVDKILRKRNVERHYTFYSFEQEDKHGYSLDDDNKKHVYYALKTGEEDKCAVYKFVNGKTKSAHKHRISGLGTNTQAPNFSKKSFLFDNVDIWDYLKKYRITVGATIIDNNITMYKIHSDGQPIAFAKKRKSKTKNSKPVYSLRTYEKKLDLIFITLFAIARTEKTEKTEKAEN